jgi:hypothetical protein
MIVLPTLCSRRMSMLFYGRWIVTHRIAIGMCRMNLAT